jgi:hypothetical protein
VARRHPINRLRKQQLLDQLIAEYQPRTTMLHASCEHLAGILEQLETMKPGSPDHQRLVQLSQLLGASLEESRTSSRVDPPLREFSQATDDQMIDETTKILHHLLTLRDSKLTAPATTTNSRSERDAIPEQDAAASEIEAPTPATPEEECPYCRRPLSRCEEIKQNRPDVHEILHWNDPEQVRRRHEDELDQLIAYRQGWPTERMLERAQAREHKDTPEEARQREERIRRGWEDPLGRGTRVDRS